MDKDKDSAPKLIHTMTEQEKEKFYEYQTKSTRAHMRRLQHWKATALERVGNIVVK